MWLLRTPSSPPSLARERARRGRGWRGAEKYERVNLVLVRRRQSPRRWPGRHTRFRHGTHEVRARKGTANSAMHVQANACLALRLELSHQGRRGRGQPSSVPSYALFVSGRARCANRRSDTLPYRTVERLRVTVDARAVRVCVGDLSDSMRMKTRRYHNTQQTTRDKAARHTITTGRRHTCTTHRSVWRESTPTPRAN